MANNNFQKSMTDFMKNYRQAQKAAKTFEGMQYAMEDMLQETLFSRGQSGGTNETKQEKAPVIPTPAQEMAEVPAPTTQPSSAQPEVAEVDNDTVEYTYQPGDTFGQVIRNLGLVSENGLWGRGGDVEYYTQQLVDQGALDRNGNIPIGTTIRLRRRGANPVAGSAQGMGRVAEISGILPRQTVSQRTPRLS